MIRPKAEHEGDILKAEVEVPTGRHSRSHRTASSPPHVPIPSCPACDDVNGQPVDDLGVSAEDLRHASHQGDPSHLYATLPTSCIK